MFVKYFIWPALQANALYEGNIRWPRPVRLNGKLLVDTALAEALHVATAAPAKATTGPVRCRVHALAPSSKLSPRRVNGA